MSARRVVSDGMEVRVRVQPRARRLGIVGVVPGVDGTRPRTAVSAAPVVGRTNGEVAAALGAPLSALTLAAGSGALGRPLSVRRAAAALASAAERSA